MEKKNAIILTSGLSGSSVLTALIARAGYWVGDETFTKEEYATFENAKLIELNVKLFKEVGYEGNYLTEFAPKAVTAIESLYSKMDVAEYRDFVAECNASSPWIWKDPRLWMTIRFWRRFLPLEDCRFILLTRSSLQIWISAMLRRQITTYRYHRRYEGLIADCVRSFLREQNQPCLHVTYENLIARPADVIAQLNAHLGTNLTVDDLRAVYNKPLYRSPRNSGLKHLKAMLIYVKNYSSRLDVTP
jgi:hypothetical protein